MRQEGGPGPQRCPRPQAAWGMSPPPAAFPAAPKLLPSFLTKLSSCGSHNPFLLLDLIRFSSFEHLFLDLCTVQNDSELK